MYFAGGQTSYGSRLVTDHSGQKKVRVVSIPSFYETGTIVLVNINSPILETTPVTFSIGGKTVKSTVYTRPVEEAQLEEMEGKKKSEIMNGFGCRFNA